MNTKRMRVLITGGSPSHKYLHGQPVGSVSDEECLLQRYIAGFGSGRMQQRPQSS